MSDKSDFDQNAQLEQFRSVIQIASMALRSAVLINGGAAIALLTFIGNADGKASTGCLVLSLQVYCVGVTLAAFATGLGYFAQNAHLATVRDGADRKPAIVIGRCAAILVLLSYTAFIVGSFVASYSFN